MVYDNNNNNNNIQLSTNVASHVNNLLQGHNTQSLGINTTCVSFNGVYDILLNVSDPGEQRISTVLQTIEVEEGEPPQLELECVTNCKQKVHLLQPGISFQHGFFLTWIWPPPPLPRPEYGTRFFYKKPFYKKLVLDMPKF